MKKRLVHNRTLRAMFRDVGYEDLIVTGRASRGAVYSSAPGPVHQEPGSISEVVAYMIDGEMIAACHQYRLPGGGLGASDKPDPKLVTFEGVTLYCHNGGCRCQVCASPDEDWRTVLQDEKGLRR